jgi:glycosyltransferase involved in cell wall biosynthesis
MPFFNASRFLSESLGSVCSQSLTDIEIIAVNDGSTDDSLQIAQGYADKDRRIVIVDKANGGYGQAMNCGMALASGEYIGIVEADDYVSPVMYERLYTCASDLGLDFVRSDFNRFYDIHDGRRVFQRVPLSHMQGYYSQPFDPQADLGSFGISMQNWTGIYSTDFISRHDIRFNESPGASFQDNGFWFQTYLWGTKAICVDEAFYNCRRDNPASSVSQTDKVHQMLDEYAWIRALLAQHPMLEQRYLGVFHLKKSHNCFYSFTLLAEDHQTEFIRRYGQEFRDAMEQGEVDKGLFTDDEWDTLVRMSYDAEVWLAKWRAGEAGRRRASVHYRNSLIAEQLGRKALIGQCLSDKGVIGLLGSLAKGELAGLLRG